MCMSPPLCSHGFRTPGTSLPDVDYYICGLIPCGVPSSHSRVAHLIPKTMQGLSQYQEQILRMSNHDFFPYFSNEMILPYAVLRAWHCRVSWPEVETQAELQIRACLSYQLHLIEEAGGTDGAFRGLFWYLGSIGPDWRVFGAIANQIEVRGPWGFVSWFSSTA